MSIQKTAELFGLFAPNTIRCAITVSIEAGEKEVGRGEGKIGWIDDDRRFHYEAAPTLREALGWAIATDGGRDHLIEYFDLDRAARDILDAIRTNGVGRETFFGAYFEVLKKIFVCGRTSRFADGYCGHVHTLWHVATRELGKEHEGYSFMH